MEEERWDGGWNARSSLVRFQYENQVETNFDEVGNYGSVRVVNVPKYPEDPAVDEAHILY